MLRTWTALWSRSSKSCDADEETELGTVSCWSLSMDNNGVVGDVGVPGRDDSGESTSSSRLSASIGEQRSDSGVAGEGGESGGTVGACWGCPMMYTALLWTGPAILTETRCLRELVGIRDEHVELSEGIQHRGRVRQVSRAYW